MSSNPLLASMQSQSLGNRPEFKHLDSRYLCVKCGKVLLVPMMTHCGHRLCHQCGLDLLSENDGAAKCPANQEDCFVLTLDTLIPDFGTHKDLQKAEVYCPNRSQGCEELIPWGKLKEHLEKCQYVLVPCVNKGFGCPAVIPLAQMKKHLSECQFQTKQCPHCEVRVPKNMLEDHIQNTCPAVSITCPFMCGEQSMLRRELPDHRKVCRAKPDDCKYRAMGCDFMGTEEAVRKHEKEDSAVHVEKLYNRILLLEAENENLKKKLTDFESKAPAQATEPQGLNDMKKRLEIVERKNERQEASLKNTQKMLANVKSEVDQTGSISATEVAGIRESMKMMEKSIDRTKNSSDDSRQQMIQMERTVSLCNMRVQEMDLRLQCVETANYEGILIWKIRDFKRRKAEAVSGKTVSLYSQPFYTSRYGYKACARIYLNGDGMGKTTHLSLFFVILRGDFDALLSWPFRQKVTMTLIDQEGGKKNIVDSFRADPTSNSFKKPTSDMNIASGCPLFAPQSTVEAPPFLKDDCLFLKVQVETNDLRDASYDYKSAPSQ